jgi:hypothetical protein
MHNLLNSNDFFSRENIGIFLLFIISTCWFAYQHSAFISWDFSVYVLNAKYLFEEGYYFELLRAPFTPFLIGMIAFLTGWKLAEYVYILIVSLLFLFSSCRLAESLKFNEFYFYAISLNFFILLHGLLNGTELLSLSFFQLFLANLIKNKDSGYWLSFASLTRYSFLAFSPLLIFYKNWKKMLFNFLVFLIPWLPWLAFNYLKYGNVFASVADNYALNVMYRKEIAQPFNLFHFLLATNFLLPFISIGLLITLYRLSNYARKSLIIFLKRKTEISMFFVLLISIFIYSNTPLKEARYLFPTCTPSFYFSYIGIKKIWKKRFSYVLILPILSFLSLFFYILYIQPPTFQKESKIFIDSIETLKSLNLSECSIMSNGWVLLNYFGQPSKPLLRMELLSYYLKEGETILLFTHENEQFSQTYLIYKSENYIILKNKTECKKKEIFNIPYISQLNTTIYLLNNKTIETNYCKILFENKILSSVCVLINDLFGLLIRKI